MRPFSTATGVVACLWIAATACAHADVAAPHQIRLSTGEWLAGRVLVQTQDRVVFEHPVLGRLQLDRAQVLSIQLGVDEESTGPQPQPQTAAPAPSSSPPVAADADAEPAGLAGPEPEPEPLPAPMPEPPPDPWTRQFEVGFTSNSGNTEDTDLALTLNADRVTEDHTLRLDTSYRLRTSQGDRVENRFTAGMFSEWPFNGSPWSAFTQARYDHAEFQSWEHRATGGLGIGYELFRVDRDEPVGELVDLFDLTLRTGVGLRKEWGSEDEAFNPEGIFGYEGVWYISPHQRLSFASTYYPTLDDFADYRLVNSADWSIDLDHFDGMALKLGLKHEFNAMVDPGVEEHDLSTYAKVVVDF